MRGVDERAYDLGMIRQAEVVVAAKVDAARRASHHAARALQMALLEIGERRLQRCRVALHAAVGRAGVCRACNPVRARVRRVRARRRRPRAGGIERSMPSRVEQRAIARDVRVAGGQQLLAVEDRIRAGEETQRLQLVAHDFASGRQAHRGLGHHDARDGDRAHEVERIDVLSVPRAACPVRAPAG